MSERSNRKHSTDKYSNELWQNWKEDLLLIKNGSELPVTADESKKRIQALLKTSSR